MVTLEYLTYTVELHSPTFDDTEDVHQTRIQRATRGLQQVVLANGPITETIHVQFTGVTETQRDDFIEFIRASLGQEIQYTDQNSNVWTGIIVNPNESMTEYLPNCGYEISFTLEGTIARA